MATLGTMVKVKVGSKDVDLGTGHQLGAFIKSRLKQRSSRGRDRVSNARKNSQYAARGRIELSSANEAAINAELKRRLKV